MILFACGARAETRKSLLPTKYFYANRIDRVPQRLPPVGYLNIEQKPDKTHN